MLAPPDYETLGQKKYGWKKKPISDDKKDYFKRINSLKENCDLILFKEFEELIKKYNKLFPSNLKY